MTHERAQSGERYERETLTKQPDEQCGETRREAEEERLTLVGVGTGAGVGVEVEVGVAVSDSGLIRFESRVAGC